MECPKIEGLEFDDKSQAAIRRIRDLDGLADLFAGAIAVGTLMTVFTSRKPLNVSYNVSVQDWETFAMALRQVPSIKRDTIEMVAANQALRSELEGDFKQSRFWKAVYNGCQVD